MQPAAVEKNPLSDAEMLTPAVQNSTQPRLSLSEHLVDGSRPMSSFSGENVPSMFAMTTPHRAGGRARGPRRRQPHRARSRSAVQANASAAPAPTSRPRHALRTRCRPLRRPTRDHRDGRDRRRGDGLRRRGAAHAGGKGGSCGASSRTKACCPGSTKRPALRSERFAARPARLEFRSSSARAALSWTACRSSSSATRRGTRWPPAVRAWTAWA